MGNSAASCGERASPLGGDDAQRAATYEFVHRRFERHAAASPTATAVRFRDESLSYAELNRRANRLAHCLVQAAIGDEARIAVCLEPSLDVAVALLGILKAGAAYVPVDPSHPPARIGTVLEDVRPRLVLASRRTSATLAFGRVPTLVLDAEGTLLEGQPTYNPTRRIPPDWTAYVYYTSGTTGAPKGAMASYANLASYIGLAQSRYGYDGRDVIPAIARFGFSISMFELAAPLVSGGTLVVLEREHVLDLARMARTMTEVTAFHAGPSLLKNLLPYLRRHFPDPSVFSGVRHASSGGDMVPVEVLEGLRDVFRNAEVFVIYGCSEIGCMGCTYPVPRAGEIARGCVGRPFDGVVLRVADAALRQVPDGTAGEVLFAGPGVVKGYLNRADLTAERFVEQDGLRFYRTGDVGRLGPEGLELLGRSDFQVKVRGMRVELGEVEHHLRAAPGVRDAVAVARDAANGEQALVAYVVMDGGSPDAAARMAGIRRYVTERLPDFMVPAAYVELAALPLNHNMKLDRRALPAPPPAAWRVGDADRDAPGSRAPETATEERLASIWKRLLRVGDVGLDDRFFELGGDSMLALRLILEIDRELHVMLDGMEVLRESLEVQAGLCDRRLGLVPKRARGGRAVCAGSVEALHFGGRRELFGVLQRPARAWSGEAALLCAPAGHERVRAQFVLQRLARLLVERGVCVLRFDYCGCGDSLGADRTCARWRSDIEEACDELRRRTGAERVAAVGARLGGALLWDAAEHLDLARMVLWDPICDGAAHYAEMVDTHRRYLQSERHLRVRAPRARPGAGEELLGLTYGLAAIAQMKTISLGGRSAPAASVGWLATSQVARQRAYFEAACGASRSRLVALDVDCAWMDASRLEDVMPDVGVAKALVELATEAA